MSIRTRFWIVLGFAAAVWLGLNLALLHAIDTQDFNAARMIWTAQAWLTPLALVGVFIMVKDHATRQETDELWQSLGALGWSAAVYVAAFHMFNQTGQELLPRLWFLR